MTTVILHLGSKVSDNKEKISQMKIFKTPWIYEVMADADDVVTTREKCCKGIFWMFRAFVWLADLGIICWVMSETFIFCSNGSSVWLSLQSFSFKLSYSL